MMYKHRDAVILCHDVIRVWRKRGILKVSKSRTAYDAILERVTQSTNQCADSKYATNVVSYIERFAQSTFPILTQKVLGSAKMPQHNAA